MKKKIHIIALLLLLVSINAHAQGIGCAAGYDCSERGVGVPGNNQCGNGQWESLLVTQESGGRYGAEFSAQGALGRYQFVNGTRYDTGNTASLPCAGDGGQAGREGFRSCKGLQDDYARALWKIDYGKIMTDPAAAAALNNGVIHECPVTASGLIALAHNVGAGCARLWAKGGRANMVNGPILARNQTDGCTDQNGTNAVEKYACAMGGHDMTPLLGASGNQGAIATGCGFGFTPANPPSVNFANSDLIGCDPTIFDAANARVEALQQLEFDIANEIITQPTPVEQATCLDQHTEVIKAAMNGIHSNVETPNISIAKVVQQPLEKTLDQFSSGIEGTIISLAHLHLIFLAI